MRQVRPVHRLARTLLGLVLAVGAGGIVATVFSVITGIGAIEGAPGKAHDFVVAGVALTYPSANLAAIVVVGLAAVGAVALALGIRIVVRHLAAGRRFRRRLVARRPVQRDGYLLLDEPEPLAFCAGVVRPRVYLSDGACSMLAPGQLRAVIAHENHHRVRRDPLRVLLATGLAEALFFLPAIGRLRDRYATVAELRADDAAVSACGGDPGPLARAMAMFDAVGSPEGAVGIAPERVDHLLGAPPPDALPVTALAGAVLTIAGMLVIAWDAGQSAVLRATFALPVLSHRPCVVALAGLALGLAAAGFALALRSGRDRPPGAPRPPH